MSKIIKGSDRGIGLIEVLVAVGLITSIGAAVLSALITSTDVVTTTNDKAMAESLAVAQMEDIMRTQFDNISVPPVYAQVGITYPDDMYDIVIDAKHVTLDTHTVSSTPSGLQKIVVKVQRSSDSKVLATLEALKGKYD